MAQGTGNSDSESSFTDLHSTWSRLTCNVSDSVREKWWGILRDEYGQPERHYLTFNLLRSLLKLHEEYRDRLASPDAVAYALIFQNIVYNPRAGDNAEKSADEFMKFAHEAGISDCPLTSDVVDLIRLTSTHCTGEHLAPNTYGSEDRHYFLDMDMALLGGNRAEYEADAIKIRNEYGFLPEEMYKELRSKILKSFLEIPNIYATKEFRNRFEAQARKNIHGEVSRLDSGAYDTEV